MLDKLALRFDSSISCKYPQGKGSFGSKQCLKGNSSL